MYLPNQCLFQIKEANINCSLIVISKVTLIVNNPLINVITNKTFELQINPLMSAI